MGWEGRYCQPMSGRGGDIKRGSTESSICDEEKKFAKGVIGGKFTSKGDGNAECEKK